MSWLHPFIAFTLCCGVVLSLLPEGSLRRTAALVIGLVLMLCWADSIATLFHWPALPELPATALVSTGFNVAAAQEAYTAAIASGGE